MCVPGLPDGAGPDARHHLGHRPPAPLQDHEEPHRALKQYGYTCTVLPLWQSHLYSLAPFS